MAKKLKAATPALDSSLTSKNSKSNPELLKSAAFSKKTKKTKDIEPVVDDNASDEELREQEQKRVKRTKIAMSVLESGGKGKSKVLASSKGKEAASAQITAKKEISKPLIEQPSGKQSAKKSIPADKKSAVVAEAGDDDDGEDKEWHGFGSGGENDPESSSGERSRRAESKAASVPVVKKSSLRKKKSEPEPQENVDDEVGGDDDDDDDELHGFSSDDQDSSDEEEDMMKDAPAFDFQKLPMIAKDDKTVKQKLDKAKKQPTEDHGVIYLGRIPHGFYEDQMKLYFTQFGDVSRIRLSRNKKTGRSKHYAFIEFDSSRVAEIVAETMDNYLLMGHILKCKVIQQSAVHPELWIGANKKFKVLPRALIERDAHNKLRTPGEQTRATGRLIRQQELKKRKLAEMGIEYNFDDVAYKKRPKAIEV